MKKAYAALVAALLVVVIAFAVARVYLNRLGAADARIEHDIRLQKVEDSLHLAYTKMLQSDSSCLERELDSVSRESRAIMYALESQLDLYINQNCGRPQENDSATAAEKSIEAGSQSSNLLTAELTPALYEVYVAYLEKLLELPRDLSSYERKVEIRELKKRLIERFSLEDEELENLLVKARERSLAAASSD